MTARFSEETMKQISNLPDAIQENICVFLDSAEKASLSAASRECRALVLERGYDEAELFLHIFWAQRAKKGLPLSGEMLRAAGTGNRKLCDREYRLAPGTPSLARRLAEGLAAAHDHLLGAEPSRADAFAREAFVKLKRGYGTSLMADPSRRALLGPSAEADVLRLGQMSTWFGGASPWLHGSRKTTLQAFEKLPLHIGMEMEPPEVLLNLERLMGGPMLPAVAPERMVGDVMWGCDRMGRAFLAIDSALSDLHAKIALGAELPAQGLLEEEAEGLVLTYLRRALPSGESFAHDQWCRGAYVRQTGERVSGHHWFVNSADEFGHVVEVILEATAGTSEKGTVTCDGR